MRTAVLVFATLALALSLSACRCCPRTCRTASERAMDPEPSDVAIPPLVVALDADGVVRFQGETYNFGVGDLNGQASELDRFNAALQKAVGDDPATREPDGSSKVSVRIEGERGAGWHYVQWIMQACADTDIRVYKLQFSAQPSDDDAP